MNIIDSSLVVQSAASSFNNAALFAPDFFWVAILSLPLFIVTWMFSGVLNARFFSEPKSSLRNLSLILSGVMLVWLLTHGSYASLRDGISYVYILVAFALFWGTAIFTREALTIRLPAFWNKIKANWRKVLGILIMILGVVAIGYSGAPTLLGFVVQSGAAIIGVIVGHTLYKRKKSLGSIYSSFSVLCFILVVGMVMQPEFFRFGQLGNLTVIHLLFLAIFAFFAVANIILRHIKPGGWISKSWYKKFLLLLGISVVLIFTMFLITESVLAFLVLSVAFLCASILIAKHQPKSSRVDVQDFGAQIWCWSLASFGILVGQPVLVCLGILIWKSKPHEKFWGTFGNLLAWTKKPRD